MTSSPTVFISHSTRDERDHELAQKLAVALAFHEFDTIGWVRSCPGLTHESGQCPNPDPQLEGESDDIGPSAGSVCETFARIAPAPPLNRAAQRNRV